jgi:magnesium-transporting ATPase (P-type)
MCDPATLPKDYIKVAKQYAKDGCYVLGLASARINPDDPYKKFQRNQVEVKGTMECLGLILFRNELKDDTTEVYKNIFFFYRRTPRLCCREVTIWVTKWPNIA